jgi:signal transduction histidine kinase
VSEAEEGRHNPARGLARMRVGQSLAITIGALLAFAVIGIGLALVANGRVNDRKRLLLEEVGPSLRSSIQLEDALVNQETGLRGYLILRQASSLEPYRDGVKAQKTALGSVQARIGTTGHAVARDVQVLDERVATWRAEFVEPVLVAVRAGRPVPPSASELGKTLFDRIRVPLNGLQADLQSQDGHIRNELSSASDFLQAMLILAGVLILGSLLGAGVFLRRMITGPLARLGAGTRRVTGGDFDAPMAIEDGPWEISELGREIETMRERIVHDLALVQDAHAQLGSQAEELRRSNEELEQFAYVASHDLQEPLRKVTSFCQALELRYADELDERAHQYIDFAVDGAKRMQVLINDLLALSRVGRSSEITQLIELDEVLALAQLALAVEIDAAGATIRASALPTVRGERSLLVSLFQNLIGNALKFRGGAAPVIEIECTRGEHEWELAVADNGIGIEQQYGERIFHIFERLHAREEYGGTGIGLALCRKIVEYHGGRIWLDSSYSGGACFRLTLPIDKEMDR